MTYFNTRKARPKTLVSGISILFVLVLCVFASGCNLLNPDDDDSTSLLSLFLAAARSTTDTTQILMYSDANSNAGYNGNLGGRSGADAKCTAAKPSTLSCTNIRAWISIASGDAISDMPTTYSVPTVVPVRGPTGTTIATSWFGLLDGTVSDAGSLKSAGLFSGITTPYYWTGSNANNGNVGTNTCSGFTNSTSGTGHAVDSTNNGGFLGTEDQNCNSQTHAGGGQMSIVCICW